MVDSAQQTLRRLRGRARLLYLASLVTLLLILLALVGGAFFFSSAGTLAFSDVKEAEKLKAAQFDELKSRERDYQVEVANWQRELDVELKGQSPSAAQGYGPRAKMFDERLRRAQVQLESVQSALSKLNATSEAQASKDFVTPQFINASITRALVVVLIVFLVKILSGLNIYTMRLSAHYNSVADALELFEYGVDGAKLAELIAGLNSNGINFPGKEGPAPDSVGETIRAIGSIRGTRP